MKIVFTIIYICDRDPDQPPEIYVYNSIYYIRHLQILVVVCSYHTNGCAHAYAIQQFKFVFRLANTNRKQNLPRIVGLSSVLQDKRNVETTQ